MNTPKKPLKLKKLNINRETVKQLTDDESKQVNGGYGYPGGGSWAPFSQSTCGYVCPWC
jgi:hypothetical protein